MESKIGKVEWKSPLDVLLTRRNIMLLGGVGAVGAFAAITNVSSAERAEAFDTEPGPPVVPHVTFETKEVLGEADLLQEPWPMAGARITANGLEVIKTGAAIDDKRNNNQYVPNPPYNINGFRLAVQGDFAVSAHLKGDTVPQMQLYSQIPERWDDFEYRRGGFGVRLTADGKVEVQVWDGSSQTPTNHEFAYSGSTTDVQITLQRSGTDFAVVVNGDTVGTIPDDGALFDSGEVWLGINTDQDPGTVSELTAKPINGGTMDIVELGTLDKTQDSPPALQTAVTKKGFLVGTAVMLDRIMGKKQYAQLAVGGNFGRWTTEDGGKPQDIQPLPGVFTFEQVRGTLELARKFGRKVRVHAVAYHLANSQWMNELPTDTEANRQIARGELLNHAITYANFIKDYADVVDIVDVLNEAITGSVEFIDQPRMDDSSIWYKAWGNSDQYVVDLYKTVRPLLPKQIKLAYNEVGIGNSYDIFGRGGFVRSKLADWKKRGAPIDIVGFQCHVFDKLNIPGLPASISLRDCIPYDHLRTEFAAYQALGFDVQATEVDVPSWTGSASDLQAQVQQYADIARACHDAPNCTGFTTWGIDDNDGSRGYLDANGQFVPGSDLMWTVDWRPKPIVPAVTAAVAA